MKPFCSADFSAARFWHQGSHIYRRSHVESGSMKPERKAQTVLAAWGCSRFLVSDAAFGENSL